MAPTVRVYLILESITKLTQPLTKRWQEFRQPTAISSLSAITPFSPEQAFGVMTGAKAPWFADGDHAETEEHRLDFRVGGIEKTRRIITGGPFQGASLTNDSVYLDIVRDQRIVFIGDDDACSSFYPRRRPNAVGISAKREGNDSRVYRAGRFLFFCGRRRRNARTGLEVVDRPVGKNLRALACARSRKRGSMPSQQLAVDRVFHALGGSHATRHRSKN